MGKIHVLDEQLANQIAAGEVVERPSSVVKELVENAVDAGSSTIDIVIEEGGLTLIRVTDNGSGIDGDDIEMAFFRHATSKISSGKDLFRIASLGFRGEALPSIAAVARVTCISSPETSGLGRKLVIEGGAIRVNEETSAPQGTDIAVRELFYNTPARLKYMKTIQTEIGHIADYVNRLALAHPGIAITLKHNGGLLLRTLGSGDRLQTFAAIYGTTSAKTMLPVEGEVPDYDLRGYISKPEQTRANRNGITLVVNGRYIRSFVINQAIMQAYHTLLPINRFPMVVLEIGMHPSLLDVNVHPSKMEVRFSKEVELREFIEKSISDALGKQRHIPGPASSERSKPIFVQENISFHQPEPSFNSIVENSKAERVGGSVNLNQRPFAEQTSRDNGSARGNGYNTNNGGSSSGRSNVLDWQSGRSVIPKDAAERLYAPPSDSVFSRPHEGVRETTVGAGFETGISGNENGGYESGSSSTAASLEALASVPADFPLNSEAASPSFPELYWIGQLHGTYIVAQNEEGLFLIDQHAAHERIHYEYFFEKFSRPQPASQQLLVPMTLEYTPTEAVALKDRLSYLIEAGVELEPFGTHTFLVRAYPEWLPDGDEQSVIEEMIDWLLIERGTIDIGKLREKSAIMCSCKASIKANDRLTREEGEGLLIRLGACKQPYTCPHGRPIVVHMTTYQLEKMFKRVMS
ncbi:DNA mismatch repair protein MutL [Paenibacillus baekrokdamisoli]|uniref:DNA mismatch repair protein MutL n=1 Tax=Paenibacillus baekrokdamisoli TaxID=1712516 RepID=A0A3G9J920_9BACL|nr:DNA mismatch repair endonuclease MutL [Paenibacillus baekrokdamisoli]MBB3067036.1 DNA mismatch repair protein MutL [Paenibacillus baekrokdamisoli]BBH19774.1 DNA mismatch repair protein MutL [Paenibacillus baekrokdamisoli]